MHELSLCEGIIQLIESHAAREGVTRVVGVRLEIGALAGVEIQAMRFSFEAVARDTVADGARLEIIEIPGRARCPACGRTVQVAARFDACPVCEHYPLDITDGEQMRISELEVQ